MFLRTEKDLPKDTDYKADLTELGFEINDQGQFISTGDDNLEKLQTLDTQQQQQNKQQHEQQAPNFFRYHHTDSERENDRRDEAFRKCARNEVSSHLASLGLREVYLKGLTEPLIYLVKPEEPHITILISDFIDLKQSSDVVIVNGESTQDLAVWAWRHLRREGGISGGSAVGLLTKLGYGDVKFEGEAISKGDLLSQRAMTELQQLKLAHTSSSHRSDVFATGHQKKENGVIILNPGQLLYSPSENRNMSASSWNARKTPNALTDSYVVKDAFNKVAGHHTPTEHITTFMEKVLPELVNPHASLRFVGLGDGAATLLDYLDKNVVANACTQISRSDEFAHLGHHTIQLSLVQSSHTHESLKNPKLLEILKRDARGWVLSTEPKGTLLQLPEGMTSPEDRGSPARRYSCPPGMELYSLSGPEMPQPGDSIPTDRRLYGLTERMRRSAAKLDANTSLLSLSPTKSGKFTPIGLRSARTSDEMMFPVEVDRNSPIKGRSGMATSKPPQQTVPRLEITAPAVAQKPTNATHTDKITGIDAWLRHIPNAEEGHLGTHTLEPRLGTPDSNESRSTPPPADVAEAVAAMAARLSEQFDSLPEQFDSLPELLQLAEDQTAPANENADKNAADALPEAVSPSMTSCPKPVSRNNATTTSVVPDATHRPDNDPPSSFTKAKIYHYDPNADVSASEGLTNAETITIPSVTTPPPVMGFEKIAVPEFGAVLNEAAVPNSTTVGKPGNLSVTMPSPLLVFPKIALPKIGVVPEKAPVSKITTDAESHNAKLRTEEWVRTFGKLPRIPNLSSDRTKEAKANDKEKEGGKMKSVENEKEMGEKSEATEKVEDGMKIEKKKQNEKKENDEKDENDIDNPATDPVSFPTFSGGVNNYGEMIFPTAMDDIFEYMFPDAKTHPETAIARARAKSNPAPRSVILTNKQEGKLLDSKPENDG